MVVEPVEEKSSKEEYLKKILSIKGDWFSLKDYKKMRKETEEKIAKRSL